jgi:two-component system, chemotaxis family, protein-glutamate methylesterase/glutaminase
MPKIRVLVVDDAVVMRKMVTSVLSADSAIEVVGSAPNGRVALQKIPQLNPDVVTLDVEMPDMNGVEMLRELRKSHPRLPVIMFSTLTQRGAMTTMEALGAGATDYVTKPANVGSVQEGFSRLETELLPKVKAHYEASQRRGQVPTSTTTRPAPAARNSAIEVVCIGASTGGPNALADILPRLPRSFSVPVLVVQHMPPVFTQALAQRLNALGPLRCVEANDGDVAEPGVVYIAPGGRHMSVHSEAGLPRLRLNDDPPENSCRPAVDVLFRSVAEHYGSSALGVVLTGMGQDGLRGCRALRERHATVVVQDEASSVVWGMPGYVATAGLAEAILPLDTIGFEIGRRVTESRNRSLKATA